MTGEKHDLVGWRRGARQGMCQVASVTADPRKVWVIGAGVDGNEHGRGVQQRRGRWLWLHRRGGPCGFEGRDERVGLYRFVGARGGPRCACFGECVVE